MIFSLNRGGSDSFRFYTGCASLYEVLRAKGIPSEYHLNSGERNADYWMTNSSDYLLFYAGKPPGGN